MLKKIIDWLLYELFKLNSESKIVESLNFFIYDSIKIMLLLFFMIAVIGFLRTYIPQSKVRKFLTKGKRGISHIVASLFGAATPFCSCSSIPLFLGFLKAGIPLGVTFSFLVTSPLVNEYLVVLMLGFFGIKITGLYVVSGVIIGVVVGIILGKMKLDGLIMKDFRVRRRVLKDEKYEGIKERIMFGIDESLSIIRRLWLWILVAVAIGALIHNYVPRELIEAIISKTGIFTVPLAVLLGVPMYGSCASIVPIAVALFRKGIPLGTTLAFMMGTAALSLPEAIILKRAMKLKMIIIFFSIVTLGIIITGYLFNFLQIFI